MGEGYPLLIKPNSKRWGPTTLPWMAFGYNIAIAPIQTLTMYNSIANNGVMMRPYLVNAIKEEGRILKTMSPKAYEGMVCSPSTIKDLHTALEVTSLPTATTTRRQRPQRSRLGSLQHRQRRPMAADRRF